MEFFTEEEVKDILHLGDKQCKALMRTDGFPSIQIGREWRVSVDAFKEWLKNTKTIKLDYRGVSKPVGDKYSVA